MINTLPYLSLIPAHVLIALAILFFFVAKAIPGIKNIPQAPIFYLVLFGAFLLEGMQSGSEVIFFDMVRVDSFSRTLNQVLFVITAATLFLLQFSDEMDSEYNWENYGLLSTLLLGMMFMTCSIHLLMVVIAIELVSLPSYLLVAMNRKDPASKEASLKYVLFGSFATGIMLYGMSLLFGLTGSLVFADIWKGLLKVELINSPIYILALFMSFAGIAFKIAAVPFHFWCPDAYQAAPTPVTAFLSTAPKVAGLALFIRLLDEHFSIQASGLMEMIAIISMLTMTLGNLAALKQTNLKRLIAYSSISHAGFLLMGVATLDEVGRQAVYSYIPIYILMNFGAFIALIYMVKDNRYDISNFKGMIRSQPMLVSFFAICIFSLVGLPPFAGFIAKFYLFKAAIAKGLWLLVVVAGVNSVIALVYYVGILKVMIIDEPDHQTLKVTSNPVLMGSLALCSVPLVFFGLYWQPIVVWTQSILLFR